MPDDVLNLLDTLDCLDSHAKKVCNALHGFDTQHVHDDLLPQCATLARKHA